MRRLILAAAILLVAAVPPVAAQSTVPGWDSGVLVTYNLANQGDVDPLDGLAVEVDFRFDGLPISIVGHVSAGRSPAPTRAPACASPTTSGRSSCSATTCSDRPGRAPTRGTA